MILLVTLVATACADAPRTSYPLVRDSAGITIVDNGPLSDRVAFRLGEPVYRVGWEEGDRPWAKVFSGALLPGGRAAIGDLGTNEVVVLSEVGAVEGVWGGTGQGPSEIGQLSSVWHIGDDTLLVEDDGNGRMTFFHEGVATPRSYQVENALVAYNLTGVGLQDGGRSLVLKTQAYRMDTLRAPWIRGALVRHDLVTRSFDTLRTYDLQARPSPEAGPFAALGWVAVTAGALGVTRTDRAEVERMDRDGRTTHVVRWTEERRPVPDTLWDAYERRRMEGGRGRQTQAEVARDVARVRQAVTDPLPYSWGLHGDPSGNLWVGAYPLDFRHPPRYRVLSPRGKWLGWVDMPPSFEILDIGRDYVLGLHRDEYAVEAVALYRLEPPRPGSGPSR